MRLIMRGTRLAILLGTTRTLIHSSLYFLEKAVVAHPSLEKLWKLTSQLITLPPLTHVHA